MLKPLCLLACFTVLGATGCKGGGGTLTAGEVGANGAKYNGQKVKVTGIYKQGYSNGGRPSDPWALVVGDAPASKQNVSCLIPAKVSIDGRYPKITVEGTVAMDGTRVNLKDCTYTVEK